MACEDYDSLVEPLANFSGSEPVDAIVCPFASDMGAGMGLPVFSLFVFGLVGLGLTARTQHPGPILVAGILSAGVFAARVPGQAVNIAALAFFFGIVAIGFYIYTKARRSL